MVCVHQVTVDEVTSIERGTRARLHLLLCSRARRVDATHTSWGERDKH